MPPPLEPGAAPAPEPDPARLPPPDPVRLPPSADTGSSSPNASEPPAESGMITSVPGMPSAASRAVPGEAPPARPRPAPVSIPAFVPTAGPPPRPSTDLDEDVETTRLTGTARLTAFSEAVSPSATLRLWDDR